MPQIPPCRPVHPPLEPAAVCCCSSVVEHSLARFASPRGNAGLNTAQSRGTLPPRRLGAAMAIPSQARSTAMPGREGVEARRAAPDGRQACRRGAKGWSSPRPRRLPGAAGGESRSGMKERSRVRSPPAAPPSFASIAMLGDAAGHAVQMLGAGNFAPGNAGAIFGSISSCRCSRSRCSRPRGGAVPRPSSAGPPRRARCADDALIPMR